MKQIYLTEAEVCQITTLSRTTIYRLRLAGKFPNPIQISKRRVAYHASDVEEWIQKKSSEIPSNNTEVSNEGGKK